MLEYSARRVLAVGAHPDDIELGCFGSLLRMRSLGAEVAMCVLSEGERGGNRQDRSEEARRSAALIGAHLTVANLPDTQIPEGHPTIGIIEALIEEFRPTLVFVNSPNDTHQDHRNAAKAAISATRFIPHVLYYQTPSSTRDFNPQVYIDVTNFIDRKINAISLHETQSTRPYMADRTIRGLAEFLALQVYKSGRFFEGFEVHQLIL